MILKNFMISKRLLWNQNIIFHPLPQHTPTPATPTAFGRHAHICYDETSAGLSVHINRHAGQTDSTSGTARQEEKHAFKKKGLGRTRNGSQQHLLSGRQGTRRALEGIVREA